MLSKLNLGFDLFIFKAMVKKSAWVTGPPPMNPGKKYVNPGTEDQMVWKITSMGTN